MDQTKIGLFLKELRNERGLTQEQLAEKLNVSNRSVSRWETASTLPDISLMIELADYYEVDIKELLEGERKSEIMNKESKETFNLLPINPVIHMIFIIIRVLLAIRIRCQCLRQCVF